LRNFKERPRVRHHKRSPHLYARVICGGTLISKTGAFIALC
jgi:hypothetical protein